MFIPVGDFMQAIYQYDKDADGNVKSEELFGVMVCRSSSVCR